MEFPTTITGTWILLGLLVIGLALIMVQTVWGAVFAVLIIGVVWYLLYAVGDRADNRIRRGQWGGEK